MKKQIILDGEKSDWYEKAIFILKDKEIGPMPEHLFLYAEDLVENHLKRYPTRNNINKYETTEKIQREKKQNYLKRRARRIDIFFNTSLVICLICIVLVIVQMFR